MSTTSRSVFAEDPSIARRPRFMSAGWRTGLLLAYPVLAMVLVVGAILLLAYEVSRADAIAEAKAEERAEEQQAPAAPPGGGFHIPSADEMEQAFSPELIEVTDAGAGVGTRLEAEATEYAAENPEALAAHLHDVLGSTCINNLYLRTPDNLTVKFWDYCYNAPSAGDIEELVEFAGDTEAMTVKFAHYPRGDGHTLAYLVWQADTESELEKVTGFWDDADAPRSIDRVNLAVYGTGEAAGRVEEADLSPAGLTRLTAGD